MIQEMKMNKQEVPMLTKEENVKHTIILLQDSLIRLFDKMKSKNFKKEEMIEAEPAILKLVTIVTTYLFKDHDEYMFYYEIVEKEIVDHFKNYLRENE